MRTPAENPTLRVRPRPRRRTKLLSSRLVRAIRRFAAPILLLRVPRGVGIAATAFVILGSLGYGIVKGDHLSAIVASFKEVRDGAANALGFRIVSFALSGNEHASREDILATAGITGNTSLVFLDVEETRERLKTNPWIADATVLKLYPGELQVGIKERAAFALWQKEGRVSVIAEDGTVLEPFVPPALIRLPLVVGRGAERRAKDLLDLLDRYPELRAQVRASVLVGERRWNLRMRNGLDVRLPEVEVAQALERLLALDRDLKLMTRDIVAIDLRLPDRVTVRLSQNAAQARTDALKEKKPPPKKGGNA
jgi:cell division protein FtsQ